MSQSAGPDSDSVCIGIVRYVLQLRCAEGYPHRPVYQTNKRSSCGWSVPDTIGPYPNYLNTAKNSKKPGLRVNESAWKSQESWSLAWSAILKYVQSTSTTYGLRTLRCPWITRSGIVCLFGFSITLLPCVWSTKMPSSLLQLWPNSRCFPFAFFPHVT